MISLGQWTCSTLWLKRFLKSIIFLCFSHAMFHLFIQGIPRFLICWKTTGFWADYIHILEESDGQICSSHFVLVPCIIACLLHVLYSPAVNIKTSSNIIKLPKAAQVAFFKVGKFYEIFYYDAFIAQRVCGLKWMSQDKSLGWMAKGTSMCHMEIDIYGGFLKWEDLNSWMVFIMENPKIKWMMTGGTTILGNHHI